eukprot:CAMPEP_0115448288 /NCGR_PEP_ID=MMETSP0271-20121206/40412_1 /TAXON_ID=71861 /ORGANISM="Scrippsiella trochoidea, Strain CCMP3099" /LENGTH=50 /DNA_ID=CAMNT_0002874401 /DNA_START=78 /DNA_END=227 /DNA_ORIENTATION=-
MAARKSRMVRKSPDPEDRSTAADVSPHVIKYFSRAASSPVPTSQVEQSVW